MKEQKKEETVKFKINTSLNNLIKKDLESWVIEQNYNYDVITGRASGRTGTESTEWRNNIRDKLVNLLESYCLNEDTFFYIEKNMYGKGYPDDSIFNIISIGLYQNHMDFNFRRGLPTDGVGRNIAVLHLGIINVNVIFKYNILNITPLGKITILNDTPIDTPSGIRINHMNTITIIREDYIYKEELQEKLSTLDTNRRALVQELNDIELEVSNKKFMIDKLNELKLDSIHFDDFRAQLIEQSIQEDTDDADILKTKISEILSLKN